MKRALTLFIGCIALTIVGGALGSPWLASIGLMSVLASAILLAYSIDTNSKA